MNHENIYRQSCFELYEQNKEVFQAPIKKIPIEEIDGMIDKLNIAIKILEKKSNKKSKLKKSIDFSIVTNFLNKY